MTNTNTASTVDTISDATDSTTRKYTVGETIFGRQSVNRNEPVWIVAIGVRGYLYVQYHHGQHRWIHTINAGPKYRRANATDVIPSWVAKKGAIPPEPTGNPYLDNAPQAPGQAKTKVPGVNDERPARPRTPLAPADAPTIGYDKATAPTTAYTEASTAPKAPAASKAPPAVVDAEIVDEETNEAIVAVPPEGMVLVQVQAMQLAVSLRDQDRPALAHDLMIGRRLGLSRPRDVRRLVESLKKMPNFGHVEQRARDARYESRPGVWQEREVIEYWLDEAQTLKVIMRSNSKAASEIQDEVIEVYKAWRRGRTLPAPTTAPAFDIQAIVAATVGETMKAIMPFFQGMARPADPVVDPKVAEVIRKAEEKEAATKRRAKEQAEFQLRLPDLMAVFRPKIEEFVGAMLEPVDADDKESRPRWLASGRIADLFIDWLRARKAKDLPDPRVSYALLKDLTGGVRIDGKKGLVLLPLALKSTT